MKLESMYCLYNFLKTGSSCIAGEMTFKPSVPVDTMAKIKMSSLYGMSVNNEERAKLKAAFHHGRTHVSERRN